MKKLLISIFAFFIGISIFVFITRGIGWDRILETLFTFPIHYFLALFFLSIFIEIIAGWRLKFVFETSGYKFPLADLFSIKMASSAIAYLTPSIILEGEMIEVFSVSERFSLPWEKSTAPILTQKILDLSIYLLFLVLGIFTFLFFGIFPTFFSLIVAGGIISLLIILLTIFYFKASQRESFLAWLLESFGIQKEELLKNTNGKVILGIEEKIIPFFNPKGKNLWQGLGMTILKYSLILMRNWLLIFFLVGQKSIFKTLAISGFFHLAFLLPLPAAIGSQEALQIYAFSSLGFSPKSGLLFSLILRGVDVLVFLIGMGFLLMIGIKSFKKRILKRIGDFQKRIEKFIR